MKNGGRKKKKTAEPQRKRDHVRVIIRKIPATSMVQQLQLKWTIYLKFPVRAKNNKFDKLVLLQNGVYRIASFGTTGYVGISILCTTVLGFPSAAKEKERVNVSKC